MTDESQGYGETGNIGLPCSNLKTDVDRAKAQSSQRGKNLYE